MVSAIITTYKREPLLVLRALNSILNQTYSDFEIIIVDDSPDDYQLRSDVEKVILEKSSLYNNINIKYIQHKKNLGACAARNTGLIYAKGEYVAYLDDDDEWLPDKLEKQISVIEQSDSALVYCGCFCKNDITGAIYEKKTIYQRGKVFESLLFSNFIGSTSFPVIRTQFLRDVGGFDENMQSAQDYDVWLRITHKYEIDYVAAPLVIYHEHPGEQITTDPLKKIKGLERLNDKYKDYIEKNPRLFNIRYLTIAPYYAIMGDMKKAIQIWARAVKKYPSNIIDNLRYLRLIIRAKRSRYEK